MKRKTLYALLFVSGLLTGTYLASNVLHGQAPETPPPVLAPVPREMTSYRGIVKKVLPAVVSIEAKSKASVVKRPLRPPVDPSVPEGFRRFFDELPEGSDPVPQQGMGSGFFVDPKGVVVTNNHVVAGAETVTVHLQDGRKFVAKEVRGDNRTDLAVLILDPRSGPFPYLELGDSDAMEIGDRVLAVGAPFGLAGTVTHGIISGKGRNLNLNMYEDFLQTDAAINPGNSGGPLISLDGKVVGINAAIKTKSGGFQGVGLAVAANLARDVIDKLRTVGYVQRGYLGIQVRELSEEVAKRLELPKEHGVVVGDVFDGTPAAKAGLQPGDIIMSIEGKAIKDGRLLQTSVATLPVGKPASFTVFRDGKTLALPVTIEEQPKEFGTLTVPVPRGVPGRIESVRVDRIGVELADMTDTLAEGLGYRKGTQGVLITRIMPGSIAADSGLRAGMVITRIEKEIADAATMRKLLEKAPLARGVLLQVQSPTGGTNYVMLRGTEE